MIVTATGETLTNPTTVLKIKKKVKEVNIEKKTFNIFQQQSKPQAA